MKSFYSKTFFLFIRIVSCVFIAILLYLTCRAAYLVFAKQDYIHLFELILGPPSLVILALVIFKPERLTLFVPSLIFFSVANSIGNSNPLFFWNLQPSCYGSGAFLKATRRLRLQPFFCFTWFPCSLTLGLELIFL